MKTRNKIKQIAHGFGQIAYLLIGLSVVLFLIFSQETIMEYQLSILFGISAGLLGIHFFLNGFLKKTPPPQWEKIFPMLDSPIRKKRNRKRKIIQLMSSLIDLNLVATGLFLCMEWGINWRFPLIIALGLYIINLLLRASLPAPKDYNWELVYPELALGFDEDQEE